MPRNSLKFACALSMIVASGCGTPSPSSQPVPRCKFDPELKAQSAPNLPAATEGDMVSLMQNRVDSKVAYKVLYIKHRDLTAEVEACEAAQAKATVTGSGSPTSQRIERAKERIKK